jgi:hypothetical protein
MRIRPTLVAVAAALSLMAAGCVGTTGHLAIASTRDVDLQDVHMDAPGRHVVGRSCIDLIVVFPTRMPNFGDAIDEALRTSGGRVLTNVRIGYEIFYFPFVYGVACYVAEGNVK